MTTRVLPPEEWARLGDTDLARYLPLFEPADVRVVVVERDGRIVAAWGVLHVVHLEGVWIAPEYRRRGTVAARLLAATLRVARDWAPRWAFTGADTKDVAALLTKHLGAVRVPMDTYLVPMEEPCRLSR